MEYGWLLGLHLTFIAFSFFILCTPIASYLYLLGCLPGVEMRKQTTALIDAFLLWLLFLGINIVSIWTVPLVYNKSPIYKAVYSVLVNYPVNLFTLGFSGGALLYHWGVFQVSKSFVRSILHALGVALSFTVFYLILSRNHTYIVFYLIDMTSSNY